MDDSILAKFPDDDHVLGPFLGNLPPEILDAVVRNLGWFRTTFAMAGRTCREAVDRVPSPLSVLIERELGHLRMHGVTLLSSTHSLAPLAVALVEGDVEALGWLIQLFDAKGLEWRDACGLHLSGLAARRGEFASLTCLRVNGCPWDEIMCMDAAEGGHLEVLQWAHQNGCPWDEKTCSSAAMGGHLEVLQWARQNGCPWCVMTCAEAAKGGHLEMLQWARQNGCPWDRKTCDAAAGEGHLEMLQWARQNGCEWDEWTCFYAAEGGHLEVLQWAHQNGCPWDEETWTEADPRCRQYLIDHGCPGAG